jgi:hypothetical protein
MEVRTWIVRVDGEPRSTAAPGLVQAYPQPGAANVPADVVAKVTFSEPVTGVDAGTFTLVGSDGTPVPASVDQIGDGTWGIFPDRVFLASGDTYTARIAAGVCGPERTCTARPIVWTCAGNTGIPAGFGGLR